MSIAAEYRRLRSLGWTAVDAIRAARARDRFEDAEEEGLVRLRCEPEEECIEAPDYASWCRPSEAKRREAEFWALVEREGVWYYLVEVREDASPMGAWDLVDSIGMSIGSLRDTGYDVDLMLSGLDALEAQRKLQLPGTWGASCLD